MTVEQAASTSRSTDLIAIEDRAGAHNYHPLPVVIAEAKGAWVTDVDGRRYLDCLSAYSALNQGHVHPAILKAAGRGKRSFSARRPFTVNMTA